MNRIGIGRGDKTLCLKQIAVEYDGAHVLRNITFSLVPGSLQVLTGGNGSGKTTLLNVISGLVRPATGTVSLGNTLLTSLTPPHIATCGIRHVLQRPTLVPMLTVLENVMLGALRSPGERLWEAVFPRLWGSAERSLADRAMAALSAIGLEASAWRRAEELSAGQVKLAAFARAVIEPGPVFLFDEVMAGVGNNERLSIIAQLIALAHRGSAVLCVEHEPEEIVALGASPLELRDGVLVEEPR